jgi:hypothetical protein
MCLGVLASSLACLLFVFSIPPTCPSACLPCATVCTCASLCVSSRPSLCLCLYVHALSLCRRCVDALSLCRRCLCRRWVPTPSLSSCLFVCVCVSVCLCIVTACACVPLCVCVCVCVCLCVCVCVCVHRYKCVHLCVYRYRYKSQLLWPGISRRAVCVCCIYNILSCRYICVLCL